MNGGPGAGLDIDGQIRSGVEAFQQSQDPAIAVEVVNMLAEVMGIAPAFDPYAEDQSVPAASAGAVPMANTGMRFYKRGGKFVVKKFANGGGVDPAPKKKSMNSGPDYMKQNPKSTPSQNRQKVNENLNMALRFKNQVRGTGSSPVVGGQGKLQKGFHQGNVNANANQYVSVDPAAIQRADSVINASRNFLYGNNSTSQVVPDLSLQAALNPTTTPVQTGRRPTFRR